MDADAAPETEVPRVEEGEGQEEGAAAQQKQGKKNRKFKKVENLADFYAPQAYTSATKGGGGKGEGKGKGKGDREERKGGKGKGAYYAEGGEAVPKGPEDDATKSSPSVPAGPVAVDGDPGQAKGAGAAKKKPMGGGGGKNREGGKDSGGGKGRGGKGSGGQGQNSRKGGGKGPRGPMGEGQMIDLDGDGGPKPLGPQQRPPMLAKASPGMPPLGMPQMFSNMPITAYASGMPAGMPAGIPMPQGFPGVPMPGMAPMYAMPYYVMQNHQQQQQPLQYMAAPVAAQAPPLTGEARATLKTNVQGQIEYYFGIDNLLKDVFLRKHMDEEGWVPIGLLAGFTRIQSMTMDPQILMEAIASSQLVEISPQNTHIRLTDDWPRWILQTQGASAAPVAAAARSPP